MTSERTNKIAKNTLLLYIRMLFSMLVSLYTSRIVLDALGVEDYGIYNVVGGVVVMLSILSSSLSASTSRFLTCELGTGNSSRLSNIFSTSLLIHIVLSAIVFVLAETIGVWFLNTKMIIPVERLYAANWVFQCSVLSFVLTLCSSPYDASIISHEKMKVFAYVGVLDILLRLLVVLFIAYSSREFDRLIVYSLLLVAVSILLRIVKVFYCKRHFAECRFSLSFNKSYWTEITAFAGWNFIGSTAAVLNKSGVDILMNLFMGPILNAASGVANTVNNSVTAFVGNFMVALNPQITKSYASGDYTYTMYLVERGVRFSFYVLLILALPILFETEFVLTLWLGNPPLHSANFVRLILILSLCNTLSNTLITLQLASGKIRNYQIAVGGTLLLNLPLSYVCLKSGLPPESTMIVAIFISFCCLYLRLLFLRSMVGLSIRRYLRNVCWNVFCVCIFSMLVPVPVYSQLPDGWFRCILISLICLINTTVVIYYMGCTTSERQFIYSRIVLLKKRCRV